MSFHGYISNFFYLNKIKKISYIWRFIINLDFQSTIFLDETQTTHILFMIPR